MTVRTTLFSELKAAALAATPGPWESVYDDWSDGDDALISCESRYGMVAIAKIEGGGSESGFDEEFAKEQQANTRYIATFSPSVALTLLAALEAAEQRIAEMENDEIQQRLANAEHQLCMLELRVQSARAGRIAQFRKRKAAEQCLAELKVNDGQSCYHQEQCHECRNRKSFPWVEGRIIPAWVRDIASGPQGCENTYIIAELDAGKQSQGWPQFIAAYIDIRLNRYICGNTAENVSDHVLRYLPFDHGEVEPQHAE